MKFQYIDRGGRAFADAVGICWRSHNDTIHSLPRTWDGQMIVSYPIENASKRRATLFIKKVVEYFIPNARDHYNISVTPEQVSFRTNIKKDPTIEVYLLSSMLRSIGEYSYNVYAVLFMIQRGISPGISYVLGKDIYLVEGRDTRLRDGRLCFIRAADHYFIPAYRNIDSAQTGGTARSLKQMKMGFITEYVHEPTARSGVMPIGQFSDILRRHDPDMSSGKNLALLGSKGGDVITCGTSSRRRRHISVASIKKYAKEVEEFL